MATAALISNQSFVSSMPETTTRAARTRTCYENHFLSSIIIACVLELISLYIVTSLAIFSWKVRNQKGISKTNQLCLFASLSSFLFSTITLLTFLPGYPFHIVIWIQTAFYWVGISLTYTILWVRQRRFYSNPLLANKVGKFHRILSSLVVIGIYVFLAALLFTFLSKVYNIPCALLQNVEDILRIVIAFIIAIIAFQMLLFYLLVNPLRSEDGIKTSDILCFRLKRDIYKMVVRLAICATVCIFTTVSMCVMIIIISTDAIHTGWVNVVSIDLTANIISIICTFKTWKTRLFPFCETAETIHVRIND
ncbi:unnamed protein product [Clavelina lepadiformis]|uniref:Taste receptor type 2 n=1 Tax=Clavelina lepadiformis TaxID=159417 RepID=A0ABP0GM77_CLALP